MKAEVAVIIKKEKNNRIGFNSLFINSYFKLVYYFLKFIQFKLALYFSDEQK